MTYTIKAMSELTGLPASTLRYYDKKGLLPSLKRDNNNVRIFTDEDYGHLRLIDCLKRSGLSIKDIKNFIDLRARGDEALNERLEIFVKRREILLKKLDDLQEVLSVIEYKCWYYSQACDAGTEDIMRNLHTSDIPEEFREGRRHLHNNFQEGVNL